MFTPGSTSRLEFAGVRGGGGKGGGGSAPAQVLQPLVLTDPVNGKTFVQQPGGTYDDATGKVTYTNAQDELNAEIAQREAADKTKSDTATADATQKAAADRSAWDASKQQAIDTGTQNVNSYFTSQGLDPSRYSADIARTINTQAQGIQDLQPNPISAFPDTLGASILNTLQSGRQSQAMDAVSRIFGPQYANTAIPDTADDASIESVLSGQFDPLSAQLQNAQKRHTLNDTGYQAALDAMNRDRTTARSTLGNLGSGIINSDRSSINDYITGAKNAAGSLTLGTADAFDPNSYLTGAQSLTGQKLSNIGGDLSNAVGSTKFSDLSSLLNAGGSVQGAGDPNASNPTGAVGPGGGVIGGGDPSPSFIADQVLANTKRGLGTTGAF